MSGMRFPAVAGTFYPDEEKELRTMIGEYLQEAEKEMAKQGALAIPGKLRALVVPHAGYVYSGPVAAYGYALLKKENQKKKFSNVLMIGPSHYAYFPGLACSGAEGWETPLGRVRVKEPKAPGIVVSPEAHKPEHCLEVQVPFLQSVMDEKEFTITPLLAGDISPQEAAGILKPLIAKDSLLLVSSDLSHYHPYERAKRIDENANRSVPHLDFSLVENFEACGKIGILALMLIAREMKWKGKLLCYKNSGDTAGDRGKVVGYGCYAFYE
ncbi:Memo-like protein [Candidatus Gugararchaeum adminiculabundum]|nr:Memo-like protein [Candidatus Gugararchaeum adminiculabundum]